MNVSLSMPGSILPEGLSSSGFVPAAAGAGATALASTALYLAYALNAPHGPRGG